MAHHVVKHWSIDAVSHADRPLSFFREGLPLSLSNPLDVSPIEYLLIAAAACFALSVRSVVAARGLPKTSFEVIARGEKALDLPSRLGRISLIVLFNDTVDEIHSAAIAAEAKKLCTVTNTLIGCPNLEVEARRAAPPPTIA